MGLILLEIEPKTLKRPTLGSGRWGRVVYWKGALIGCFTGRSFNVLGRVLVTYTNFF